MGPIVEKRKQKPGLSLAWGTDIGSVRSRNEDSVFVQAPPRAQLESHGTLLIVADGMGGPPAGDMASALAVENIPASYYDSKLEIDGDPAPLLRRAFNDANAAILKAANAKPGRFGMGSTCTALLLRGEKFWLAHVGDSRAYLLREGRLQQLSRDHNVLERMRAEGDLLDDDHRPPGSALLTAALGTDDRPGADYSQRPRALKSGDRLLICSDGLYGPIEEKDMKRLMGEGRPERAVKRLIRAALDAGGPDNISVIIAHWELTS